MARLRVRRYKHKAWDVLDSASAFGLKAGALFAILSALYIALGFMGKQIMALPNQNVWAQQRVIANVNIATTIFDISFLILIACLTLRRYTEDLLGYVLSLAGIALYFGVPYAILTYLGAEAVKNAVVVIIVEASRTAAVFAFLPGLALIVRDLYIRVVFALSRVRTVRPALTMRRGAGVVYRNPIYAKCWQMPQCSEFVRRVCPAFRKRKSCWRIKHGCQCDEEIMIAAMRSGSGNERLRKEMASTMAKKRAQSSTPAEKRRRCRECSIYVEHQRQKYQVMSALVVPVVIGLIALTSGILRGWVADIAIFTERFARFASYQPEKSPIYNWVQGGGDVLFLQWAFVIWFGILALSYALQAIEYYVFKLQL